MRRYLIFTIVVLAFWMNVVEAKVVNVIDSKEGTVKINTDNFIIKYKSTDSTYIIESKDELREVQIDSDDMFFFQKNPKTVLVEDFNGNRVFVNAGISKISKDQEYNGIQYYLIDGDGKFLLAKIVEGNPYDFFICNLID
ncbi:MAG: hypothetical protein ACRC92_26105 [Peptostreptococcaceae bacterium]